jgi:L-alanine-DL-glutamate epimerase-like enolase superfamily enzyme
MVGKGDPRITRIEAIGLRGGTPEGGWSEEIKPDDCVHTLIFVDTDQGVTGLGSVFTNDNLVEAALGVLEPLYTGESAIEPERVSEKLRQHMFWLGRGGSVEHTISGIDIALWDVLGKVTGQPIGRLLGGMYRRRVMPYASILMEAPEPLSEKLQGLMERGFAAFKIGWGPFGRVDSATDEVIVKAAREAVGDDVRLMVDPGGSDAFWTQGYKWGLRTAHMLARYGVDWFEEPFKPDAIDDYVRLREHAPLPISGGEVLTRRQSFQTWIERGAFDIVQPDVTKVGGITESRRIAWMAQDHGIRLIPHGWNTAVGLAADLQLASAFPETDLVEYLIGSPYVDGIAPTPWKLDDDGMLNIPDAPGLGLELDRQALAQYSERQQG